MNPGKSFARKLAAARRAVAFAEVDQRLAQEALSLWLAPYAGRILAGYMPIRTEIDPVPVMAAMAAHAPVCVPFIDGPGQPLRFRTWRPGCLMTTGPFGTMVPDEGAFVDPEVLITPLLAFDTQGVRLGYGGGYYDRTLARLRDLHEVHAVGFAFQAQRADILPAISTDQRLDAVVTEAGPVFWDGEYRLPPPGGAPSQIP